MFGFDDRGMAYRIALANLSCGTGIAAVDLTTDARPAV